MSITKSGIVISSYKTINNLYPGTQTNCSKGSWEYNVKSDIFKDYGFSTCSKWKSPGTTTTGLGYSYLLSPSVTFSAGDEFILSMYTYVSEDCNAGMWLRMENDGKFINSNINLYDTTNNYIYHEIKGQVVFVWAKFTITKNGGILIMFYPARGTGSKEFSSGYQLFAGITIYKGNELTLPMNNNIPGSGFVEIGNQNKKLKINKKFITAKDFI